MIVKVLEYLFFLLFIGWSILLIIWWDQMMYPAEYFIYLFFILIPFVPYKIAMLILVVLKRHKWKNLEFISIGGLLLSIGLLLFYLEYHLG
jgi:hypothetical protein